MYKKILVLALVALFISPSASFAASATSSTSGTPTSHMEHKSDTQASAHTMMKKMKKSKKNHRKTALSHTASSTTTVAPHEKSKLPKMDHGLMDSTTKHEASRDTQVSDQQGPVIAVCKDGSNSHAKSHSGACASHGGVAKWQDGTAN